MGTWASCNRLWIDVLVLAGGQLVKYNKTGEGNTGEDFLGGVEICTWEKKVEMTVGVVAQATVSALKGITSRNCTLTDADMCLGMLF